MSGSAEPGTELGWLAGELREEFPGIGDGEFSCNQLGRTFKGQQIVRPTPNPNFRRVDANIADEDGVPLLRLSTILTRYP